VNGLDVAALRAELRLSRSMLARFVGVSDATVVRWERKGAQPRGLVLLLLGTLARATAAAGAATTRRIVKDGVGALGPAWLRLFNAAAPGG
jgi:DNA-binding XRE family transcriptional regulator